MSPIADVDPMGAIDTEEGSDMRKNSRGYAAFMAAGMMLAACSPSREAANTGESLAAVKASRVVEQAGEVMAARVEAQHALDSARVLVNAGKAADAADMLREAASFTRSQSNNAEEVARGYLEASANELEALATRTQKGGIKSATAFARPFPRLQLAEAAYHCARAVDAGGLGENGTASAEIVMLTDHFERAFKDAQEPLSMLTRERVSRARELAARMAHGEVISPAELSGSLELLDADIHAAMGRMKGGN